MQAVNQLCSHFEAYKDVPKIAELREKFKGIKDMLKSHIFSDFARWVLYSKLILVVYGNEYVEHGNVFWAISDCQRWQEYFLLCLRCLKFYHLITTFRHVLEISVMFKGISYFLSTILCCCSAGEDKLGRKCDGVVCTENMVPQFIIRKHLVFHWCQLPNVYMEQFGISWSEWRRSADAAACGCLSGYRCPGSICKRRTYSQCL